MYEISVHREFAAAHSIRLYDGELETIHGHNWSVVVTVANEQLDDIEVVMDFHLLDQLISDQLEKVHNKNLNDVAPFSDGQGQLAINPTAERVAWWLGTQVAKGLPAPAKLVSVKIGEAPGCVATYRPK